MENGAVESRLLASTKANLPTQNDQFSRKSKPERKLSDSRSGITLVSAAAGMDPMASPSPQTAQDDWTSVENNAEFDVNSSQVAERSGEVKSSPQLEVLGTENQEEGEVSLTLNLQSSCSNGENSMASEGQDFVVTLKSRGPSSDREASDGNRAAQEIASSGDNVGDDSAQVHPQGVKNEKTSRVDFVMENGDGLPPDGVESVAGQSNSEHNAGTVRQDDPSIETGSNEGGSGNDFGEFGDFAEPVGSVPGSDPLAGNLDGAGDVNTSAQNRTEVCADGGFDDFGDFAEADVPPVTGAEENIGKPEMQRLESGGAEEFGDFVETSLTEDASGRAPESNDAGFGDFAEAGASTSPTKESDCGNSGSDEFGDFGDFAEAEVSVGVAEKGVTDEGSDDFGDFGEFAEASPSPLPPTVQRSGTELGGIGMSPDAGADHSLDGLMSMSEGALLSAVADILKPLLAESQVAGSSEQPGSTSTAGDVTLKAVRETKFRLPPESALGANLLQVKPVPPGFLRGCGPPAVLAARVARTEQKLLRSLGLLDAYTRASMEEQFTVETEEPVSGSESFRGILESGSLSSLMGTPRIVETPVTTDGDLDFLVQASAGSGVLPAQAKSELSFSSTGEPLAVSTPLNSSGSPSPTKNRHNRDLSSIFDNLADLAPIIPNAAETEEPAEGMEVDEPGMEPPKPRISIEPVKSLDMWGMGQLTTLEAASAQATEPAQGVDGDFGGLNDLMGPSAEIQRAMQGSILIEGAETSSVDMKSTGEGVSGETDMVPVSLEGPRPGLKTEEAKNEASMSADFGDFVGGSGVDKGGVEVLDLGEGNSSGGMDVFGGFVGDGFESEAQGSAFKQRGFLETEAADAPSQTPAAESSFPGFDDFLGGGREAAIPSPNTPNTGQVRDEDGFGDFLVGGKAESVTADDGPTQIGPDDNPTISSEQPPLIDPSADLEWGGFESPNETSPPGEVTQDAEPEGNPIATPELPEPEDLFTDDWLVSLKGNKKPDQEATSIGNQVIPDSNGAVGNDDGEWGDFSTATNPPHVTQEVMDGDASDPFGFVSKKLGFSPRAEVEAPKPVQPTRVAMKDMAPAPKKTHVGFWGGGVTSPTKPLELFDGLDLAGDESTIEGGTPGSGGDFSPLGHKSHESAGIGIVGKNKPLMEKLEDDDEWGGFQDM